MHPSKLIDPARVVRSRLTRALCADLLGGRGRTRPARAKFTSSAAAGGKNGGPVEMAGFRAAGCAQGKDAPNGFTPASRASGKIV